MAEPKDSTKKTTKSLMGGLMSLLRGSNKDSETLGKNSSDSQILGGIYKLMVQKEAFNKLEHERRSNYLEEEEIEKNKRHNEIIKALSIRRKPAPKKVKAKKGFRMPKLPGLPGKTPAPSKAPAPAAGKPPAPARPSAPAPSQTPPKPDAGEIARQQAAERARRAASEKTRKDAEDKARKEAQERAAREAQERATREAAEAAKIEGQRRAAREAQERAAREAKRESDRETRRSAERAAREKEAARRVETPPAPSTTPAGRPDSGAGRGTGRAETPAKPPTAAPAPAAPAPTTAPPSAARMPATRPPATAQRQPSQSVPPAASTGIQTATAFGSIVISGAAYASMKGEQGVSSVTEALTPVTNPETARKHGIPIGVSKVGAATPDLQNSTSYGLFGINNIRARDKEGKIIPNSSMDSFVQMFPQFGLPDTGSNLEPDQTKKFNEAWWNLARTRPEELLKAQLQWFDKKFEQPTKNKLLETFAPNIANDPGVVTFMTDRRIQYGPGITFSKSVMEEGKKAKTPEEFIRIISDYDRRNLRRYFSKTSDAEYNKLEKGLLNRIELRIQKSLKPISSASSTQNLPTVPSTVGSSVNDASVTNADARKQMSSGQNTPPIQQTTNNMNVAPPATAQQRNRSAVDDSSAYSRKTKQ